MKTIDEYTKLYEEIKNNTYNLTLENRINLLKYLENTLKLVNCKKKCPYKESTLCTYLDRQTNKKDPYDNQYRLEDCPYKSLLYKVNALVKH